MKKYIIGIIALVVLVSISANGYFFFNNWIKGERQNYFNAGAIQLRENVYNAATQNGFVIIANSKGEQLRLIKE